MPHLPALPSGRGVLRAAVLATLCVAGGLPCRAQSQTPSLSATAGKVVVSGAVPDEATRAAILARVRELYGAERVVDQLGIDQLVAPPNWAQHVQRVLTPELKQVTQGRLRINGNVVEVMGHTESETAHQQLIRQMVMRLDNPTYTVRDGLRVQAPAQQLLDAALAQRTVEFEPGNATLTPVGVKVLDDLLPLLRQFAGRRFEVVGHTDDRGARAANLQLSAARAEAVKAYLVARGIAATDIQTSGAGPDRPVADNQSPEGRARNRRIEFRVLA
ncbi:OmpA family protein [Azohydromonas caseinilytica]|uniref:OmpA family protein n=1 Tax=Azohydromonas caseinilytica TaxID=2728836 RepID=A0A848FEZ1_9BURK|nr:OmpA family protein [Azohydromonas caseinilytica]NML18797.1 OmpA family protein [Azohydromonas caseinilytica]